MKRNTTLRSIEWPTLGLFVALYTLWVVLTWQISTGTVWPYAILWLLLTLHSSLQHEVLHGHPTRSQTANTLLVSPAIGLLLPYQRFKDLHLLHHSNESLTDPFDDTESYFMAQAQWQKLSPLHQRVLTVNNTLLGRLVLGPWIMYARFFRSEALFLLKNERSVLSAWVKHAIGLAPVIVWLALLDISLITYLLVVVWPATALLLLRSYTEHLPDADVNKRTAIVISNKFMGLMFLNNNFHVVHHDHPRLPWHRIPARYYEQYHASSGRTSSNTPSSASDYNLESSASNPIKGYGVLFKQYALTPRFPVAHPVLRTNTQSSNT